MKNYTKTQQIRLFKLEQARLKQLKKISARFFSEEQRNSFATRMVIYADYLTATTQNENDILDVILENIPEPVELHTTACNDSYVELCICGNSLRLQRTTRPSGQKGFLLL